MSPKGHGILQETADAAGSAERESEQLPYGRQILALEARDVDKHGERWQLLKDALGSYSPRKILTNGQKSASHDRRQWQGLSAHT